ncbi:hypothetical protein F4820DRAFT_465773 [Hypoxylon rubiginosum]|uniref:Uncharacterized protein n=1 Tax=Hypoxylon rubiginosum TaxID=110542 RepID=A0ACB9YMJ0_9PEZI|nr:hypothetical protein F4820DRAFT_465773 [Hypoxylon rubiginosum]
MPHHGANHHTTSNDNMNDNQGIDLNSNTLNMDKEINPEVRALLLATRWPIFPGESTRMLGFQAVLRFLRHLYSYVPKDLFRDASSEPLLVFKLAGYVYDKKEEGIMKVLKRQALGELCLDWDSNDRAETPGFFELIQGDKLISHLWSRQEYLLFNPRVISLDPGQDIWAENDPPRSMKEVALHSLIKYDGTGPIEGSVNELFGSFLYQTGYRYMRLPMMPLALRVLYTPSETASVGFSQLRSFQMRALDFEPKDEPRPKYKLKEMANSYLLVATVRLRANSAEVDLIRTYDQYGTYLIPPRESRVIRDDEWKVGQQGHSYMLMYISLGTNTGHMYRVSGEVTPLDEASEDRLETLEASCASFVDVDFDATSFVDDTQHGSDRREQSATLTPGATETRLNNSATPIKDEN